MFDQLVLATHNQGKVDEFAKFLDGLNIDIQSAAEFGLAGSWQCRTFSPTRKN